MQDEHTTDAQEAADAILSDYGVSKAGLSLDSVRNLVAFAYAKGMSAGIAECSETLRKMAGA
jgi:hypothetical protein